MPAASSTRPPELTRSPSARTIGSAFAFNGGDRWVLGYVDRALVLAPEAGAAFTTRSTPVGLQSLRDFTFIDELHGWATGRIASFGPIPGCAHAGSRCTDVILATVDGGRTWSIIRSVNTTGITGDTFRGLQFIDARHGWTVQYLDTCSPCKADLLATVDGGATWTVQSSASQDRVLNSFRFVDALHGWAIETDWWPYFGAASGTTRLLATGDGGKTWTAQLDGVGVYDITVLDRSHAWVIARDLACAKGSCPTRPTQLYRTTDGDHWSLVVDNFESFGCVGTYLFRPTFIDAERGLITSGGPGLADPGGVLSSKDGGSTWSCAPGQPQPANAQEAPLIYSASFVVVTRGTDGSDHLLMTTDLGATWTERVLPRF